VTAEPPAAERRCPNCGGLVGADAEWCGQCFTRLDREAPGRSTPTEAAAERPPPTRYTPGDRPETGQRAPAAPGGSGIRVEGDQVLWDCPRCGTENPIEADACGACGASFGQLFASEEAPVRVPSGRAVGRSLLFPGLGHAAVGRTAEGWARGVVFAYAAVSVVAILVMRAGSGLGPFLALFVISVLAAVTFYALAAIDAGRLANEEPQILSPRGLLYGATALILLTVVVLVVIGIRASGRGG
jgi:hypothetical protein